MNSKIVFLLALLALGSADDEDCNADLVQSCLDNFLESLIEDSDDAICKSMKEMNTCLRTVANNCLGDSRKAEVDNALKDLEDMIEEKCPMENGGEEEEKLEDDSCLADNEDYVLGCMGKSTREALRLLQGETDPNKIQCTVYSLISNCVVERTVERCGAALGDIMKAELENPPQEIKDACDQASSIDVSDFQSLLFKKRK